MSTPRPDQAKVIAYAGGAVAVAAVPGAGKTFVLKELAARLIEERQAAPSQLLLLTYMRTGALNLRDRIQTELAARGRSASGLRVMTIHAFCHQLLARHAAHLVTSEHSMISEAERWMLLTLGLEQFLTDRANFEAWQASWATAELMATRPKHLETLQGYALTAASEAVSAMKAFRLPVDEAVAVMARQGFPEVAHLLRFYHDELKRRHQLDYDDLVAETIALLEAQPALAAKYQRHYRFVLEDEAQDSTYAQQRLLGLLTAGHGNLLRVGDTNQAILSTFTFNDPKYFRDFLHQAERLPLEESGRSARAIQRLANQLIDIGLAHPRHDRVQAFERQLLKPSSIGQSNPPDELGAIRFLAFPDIRAQDAWLVQAIRKRLAELNPAEGSGPVIGVLTRSNARADAIGKALAEVGIQAWMPGKPVVEADLALVILADVVRFLCLRPKPGEGLLLLIWRILDNWQLYHQRACDDAAALHAWIKTLDRKGQAMRFVFPELVGGSLPARPPEVSEADYARLLDLCDAMRELLSIRHRPLVEVIAWACERLFATAGAVIAAHRLALALRRAYYRNPEMDLEDACDFIEDLVRKSRRSGMMLSGFDEDEVRPAVMVTTVHKSKGMEFDTVYVADVVANGYPWQANDEVRSWDLDKRRSRIAMRAMEAYALAGEAAEPEAVVQQANYDEIGESLRLLYVAITRAERRLVLTSHREPPWPRYSGPLGWPWHVQKLMEAQRAQDQVPTAE